VAFQPYPCRGAVKPAGFAPVSRGTSIRPAVPVAAAVIGLTMAMLLSATERNRLDAPVRERVSTTDRFGPAHHR